MSHKFHLYKIRIKGTGTFLRWRWEFDGRRGINLVIWSHWLYHGTDDKLALVVTVASIVTGITGSLQRNRLIKSNQTLLMICIMTIYITTHQYGRYFGQRWTPTDVESVLFLAWKPAILNIAWVIRTILPKRRHLSTHFGLKYLSNDSINRYLFYRKNFPKVHTFRPGKKLRVNFEWSIPLKISELW